MSPWLAVRIGLVVFVLAWIFGPGELRATVPLLLVFVLALGLEVSWLASALRERSGRTPDRRPQEIDRRRYGFEREPEDIVVVEAGDEDVWLGISPELDEDGGEQPFEPQPELAARRSPVRRFLVGIGIIAALLGGIWLVESRTGWDAIDRDRRSEAVSLFADEASRIAGKPVTIYCDESRDFVGAVQHADGVAVVGGDHAYVTPEICHDLYRLAFEDEPRGSRTARALAVLAHEAWHLRGVRDEGATECYALQSGVELGRRLGLSEDEARRMMRQQLTENALRRGGGIEYRVPAECRDGGRFDLDPEDSRFP